MIHIRVAFVAAGIALMAGIGPAAAAGLTKAQCDQLDREQQQLQDKQNRQHGKLNQHDRNRLSNIESQSNVYCGPDS
jgi:hypothetical protein